MSRGPLPGKAIAFSLPIAEARGFVIFCRRERESVCDIMILGPGITTIVRIVRTKRLRGSMAEMEAQFAGAAAGLCTIPGDPGRVLEIWACNYYGNIWFFRVGHEGLAEIGRDGRPVGECMPVILSPSCAHPAKAPGFPFDPAGEYPVPVPATYGHLIPADPACASGRIRVPLHRENSRKCPLLWQGPGRPFGADRLPRGRQQPSVLLPEAR